MAKKNKKKAKAAPAGETSEGAPVEAGPIKQGTPEHDRRHVPGEQYALGTDGTWIKECLPGKVSKRLKALDAQAVRVTFTLKEKISDTEERLLLDVDNSIVDLRQAFEEEEKPELAYIRRPWSHDILKVLRLICMTMTIDEKCKVDIPVTTQDVKLTHPWEVIVELHDHYQASWPWPVPEKEAVRLLDPAKHEALAFEPLEEQERVLKELTEAQVRAEKPWWDLRDTVVTFVGQTTLVSSWKPARFSRVAVNYRLRCADTGEVIWDTYEQNQAHYFTIGCGDVLPALDIAVRQNFSLGQKGFIIAKPVAGFGPYDHSLEAAKIFHKRFLDGFAFMEGYESVFDQHIDSRIDRECINNVVAPNDYDPVGEERRAEAQARRAQGLPVDRSDMPKVEEVPDCVPEFLLAASSVDMSKWAEKYQNRHLIFESLDVKKVLKLPNETTFKNDEDRVRFARRWKEVGVRFWRIKDYVRAYQCFYQAIFILEPLSTRIIKVGPNEDDDCKSLKNKCVINSAVCLGKLEDWKELEKVLDPVLKRNPDNEKAIYWMACVELSKGDETTAMDSFKRLLNMNPHNLDARRMLVKIKEIIAKREGAFTKNFVQPTSLTQPTKDPRETPAPDWTDIENAGYDTEMLKAWGIRPAKTVDQRSEEFERADEQEGDYEAYDGEGAYDYGEGPNDEGRLYDDQEGYNSPRYVGGYDQHEDSTAASEQC